MDKLNEKAWPYVNYQEDESMEYLTNIVIKAVKEHQGGTNEFGAWTRWGILINDTWYNYMQSSNKPGPVKGMKLKLAEVEFNQEYNNWNMKSFEPVSNQMSTNNQTSMPTTNPYPTSTKTNQENYYTFLFGSIARVASAMIERDVYSADFLDTVIGHIDKLAHGQKIKEDIPF